MAVIETKFDVGDTVFHANITTERRRHPCPDCLGSREWACTSPAGGTFKVPCPRCGGGYQSNHALSLDYSWWVPSAQRLTIGSVRVDTHSGTWGHDEHNHYMCVETGVGSGSIYKESSLFATEEEALRAAQTKADLNNADASGWVAKQYAESVKFSDYELRDAAIKAAEDRASSVAIRHRHLKEDIADATSLDEVKGILERFENAQSEAA
jgi:hypothetical protein